MNEKLQELLNQDADFSESAFKSKVENEYVKIKLALVTGNTEKIKHFVSDEVYAKINSKIINDKNNNRIQMYDELNVFNVNISNVEELEDRFRITTMVHSKALVYYIDRTSKKFLSGNNQYRIDKKSTVIFEKIKKHAKLGNARKCPFCAAPADINYNGKCRYCGGTFPLENYDWVITQMEI